MTVSSEIISVLADGGYCTSGVSGFASTEIVDSSIPIISLFCWRLGGGDRIEWFNASNDNLLRDMPYRVLIRHSDWATGYTLAGDIWSYLNGIAVSGTFGLRCQQSSPQYFGRDDLGQHRWVMDVKAYSLTL